MNQPIEPTTCPVFVYREGYRRSGKCGKPIKRNGKCGLHASAEERAVAKRQNDLEMSDRRARVAKGNRDRFDHARERLAKVGVTIESTGGYPAYRPTMTADQADRIADRLGGIVVRDDDYLRERLAIRLAAAAGHTMEQLAEMREAGIHVYDIRAEVVLHELRWISEDQR